MRNLLISLVVLVSAGFAAAPRPIHAMTLAADVIFDNAGTSFSSTNVQDALVEVDAALLGDPAHFVDIQIDEPILNGTPHGLHWPITDPATTEIFLGLLTTDEGGALAQPNNVLCLAYNFDECGDARIDLSEHAYRWSWSSGRQTAPGGDLIVENEIVFTASDGTTWRPWAFHINATTLRASLRFDTESGKRAFTIQEDGNVRIGPEAPGQATRRLEVIGDALVDEDLEVSGDLIVQGAILQAANPSLLLWGDANSSSFDTGSEVCAGAGLSCFGALEPDGTPLTDCDTQATSDVFYAMCRQ